MKQFYCGISCISSIDMAEKIVFVLIVLTSLCYSSCCGIDTTKLDNGNMTANQMAEPLDQEAIMMMCNETFRTSMDYLVELNTTGTFPDESDKTPMCYIRCYLEHVGIIKQDELDRDKAVEMAWATADETLDECNKEASEHTNPCEKAYFLTRCVMMRNIVDNRTSN